MKQGQIDSYLAPSMPPRSLVMAKKRGVGMLASAASGMPIPTTPCDICYYTITPARLQQRNSGREYKWKQQQRESDQVERSSG
jgi:hypothetical protein